MLAFVHVRSSVPGDGHVGTIKLLGVNDLTLQVEVGRVEYGARRHA